MYSQNLEAIIDAALADGVLTDKERAVLHKKAAEEGVDPDELDVVIEGRLAKMKKIASPVVPAKEKRGNVITCPSCGAIVEAGSTRCKECGYVFTNVNANRSATSLFDAIQKEMNSRDSDEVKNEKINMLINSFPVPTAKEDILEFLYMGIPNAKKKGNIISLNPVLSGLIIGVTIFILISIIVEIIDGNGEGLGAFFLLWMFGWWFPLVLAAILWFLFVDKSKELKNENKRASAWKAKCSQAISKARISLADDPDLPKIEELARQVGI